MTTSTAEWYSVCPAEALPADRGVAALVGGTQIAIFHVPEDGRVFALANIDPYSGVGCLSRGIVGDVSGELMVASPLHKQRYSLRTGACLDDPGLSVQVYDARVRDGVVEVQLP